MTDYKTQRDSGTAGISGTAGKKDTSVVSAEHVIYSLATLLRVLYEYTPLPMDVSQVIAQYLMAIPERLWLVRPPPGTTSFAHDSKLAAAAGSNGSSTTAPG